MQSWTPILAGDGATLHERILSALRRDIGSGRLQSGARLPAQRTLSKQLGIALGTVTRAYSEAEQLGLLSSTVGRGTFVAATPPKAPDPSCIDLSMNLPSLAPATGRLAAAIDRLRERGNLPELLAMAPHAGVAWHRQAAANWLARTARLEGVDWGRLLLCVGAQQAMMLTLDAVCHPGDTVLTEAATFHGVRAIASYRKLAVRGLPMDSQGMCPDALDRAAAETASRIVYVQPTLQNPTARSMSEARRHEIVAVARKHGLWLLEGDVYAPLASTGTPLASLAPERTFYASSLSKALAPGLRCGFLLAPDDVHFEKLSAAMRATCFSPCPLGSALAAQWILDGTADTILDEVRHEAVQRLSRARTLLGSLIETPSSQASLHVWLPASELEAERIVARAQRQGVKLTPPGTLIVDAKLVSGLRLCLNAPPDSAGLDRALRIVARAAAADDHSGPISVI